MRDDAIKVRVGDDGCKKELPGGVWVVTCDVAATPGNPAGEPACGRGRGLMTRVDT